MASATFENTVSAVSSLLHTPIVEKQDVKTELNYWAPRKNRQETVDFTQPGGELRFQELEALPDKKTVLIRDVRGNMSDYTLEKNGFQYVIHEFSGVDDWSDEEIVKTVHIPEAEKLVQKMTGAARCFTFTHRIRNLSTDPAMGAENRAPAQSVHTDFSAAGALHHLENIIPDPAERKSLLRGRVMAINLWRPLKPIQKDPLTVCDWASVNHGTDCIAFRMLFPNGWNELGKVQFSEMHNWCYLADQKPNEALIFKQFDSGADDSVTLPHSAFVDPRYTDCGPRESIEIKMFVFVPEGN